ncbi:MAG TPA: hypothetical protein VFB38_21020 [Chthonomonadaceae bacterium]|nr:hypothetical protein [Chthonomonadaceae bacterium]
MRHAEWKKLLDDPVVLKAQEALKMAQKELAIDGFWKDKVTHLAICPDPNRKKVLQLLVTDLAFVPLGLPPLTRREIAWDAIANASSEEAKALVLAGIGELHPKRFQP